MNVRHGAPAADNPLWPAKLLVLVAGQAPRHLVHSPLMAQVTTGLLIHLTASVLPFNHYRDISKLIFSKGIKINY